MMVDKLKHDPYNLIITGVGGQGNVLASRILGTMMAGCGYAVTIGETFGASQRGGSVMSHLRIATASSYSPQIARGRAHFVVALEPTEAIRVLAYYGNSGVKVLCNTRPIYSASVISGELEYPSDAEIRAGIDRLSDRAWFVNTTDEAMARMNNPIFGNIMLLGALAGTGELPLRREDFLKTIRDSMAPDKIETNLAAFDLGNRMVQ